MEHFYDAKKKILRGIMPLCFFIEEIFKKKCFDDCILMQNIQNPLVKVHIYFMLCLLNFVIET